MTSANIVLLLKLGKDPLDPGSYRLISLLQVDIKILAKVLAMRFNQAITSIIHSDQSGFMPGKSTAIILLRLFLNMQTQVDNVGYRALLSMDTNMPVDNTCGPPCASSALADIPFLGTIVIQFPASGY